MALGRAAVLAAVVALAWGHAALVYPLTRNSVDRDQSNRCWCANITASVPVAPGSNNGQACYWYNQGCFIGCPSCDSKSGRIQSDLCGLGKQPTINDPNQRTVNRNGTGELDIYKHNPWRAPGSAPVVDSCGLAGGTPWPYNVSEWGDYVPTAHASHGAVGSKVLPFTPSGVTWKLGSEAEVVWQVRANHGGGYTYRLCPLGENLTEACFMKYPLKFNTNAQQLIFSNGTRQSIPGTFVSEGVIPANSMWAMNPVPPRCLGPGCSYTQPFCQPCPLPVAGRDCSSCDNNPDPKFPPPCNEGDQPGICSGNQPSQWGSVAVSDRVIVPSDLKPGRYVLGWRWDCEATAQVWTNCADIEISA